MPLGVVTGLELEARIARRAGLWAICGGAGPAAAMAAAERLVQSGATGLASLGIAGGLSPALPTGGIVIARAIVTEEMRFACDAEAVERLAAQLPAAWQGALYGTSRPIARAAQKLALFHAAGLLAADMESHGVARAAQRRRVPVIALRVVADPADLDLPPAALAGLGREMPEAIGGMLAKLVKRPSQLPELARLARRTAAAMAELPRCAAALATLPAAA
jgi:adenosylhomocysteine nucleosidase